ncbi:hypothetical protein CEQ90_15090 [Lewinellaceae bacterium SD302]|nr:hypothetical protein CEQ90_15090 [Lewinellaceae bacterium SD302]
MANLEVGKKSQQNTTSEPTSGDAFFKTLDRDYLILLACLKRDEKALYCPHLFTSKVAMWTYLGLLPPTGDEAAEPINPLEAATEYICTLPLEFFESHRDSIERYFEEDFFTAWSRPVERERPFYLRTPLLIILFRKRVGLGVDFLETIVNNRLSSETANYATQKYQLVLELLLLQFCLLKGLPEAYSYLAQSASKTKNLRKNHQESQVKSEQIEQIKFFFTLFQRYVFDDPEKQRHLLYIWPVRLLMLAETAPDKAYIESLTFETLLRQSNIGSSPATEQLIRYVFTDVLSAFCIYETSGSFRPQAIKTLRKDKIVSADERFSPSIFSGIINEDFEDLALELKKTASKSPKLEISELLKSL